MINMCDSWSSSRSNYENFRFVDSIANLLNCYSTKVDYSFGRELAVIYLPFLIPTWRAFLEVQDSLIEARSVNSHALNSLT